MINFKPKSCIVLIFIGVIGLKANEQPDEAKKDTTKLLLTELFDAGSMYSSGAQSCNGGMVNKLFNTVPYLFDSDEENKANKFEFEGFKLDQAGFAASIATTLYKEGKTELAEKIINNSELNRIEAQYIAAQSYKILKETKKNDNPDYCFSDIVYYGEGRNMFEGNDRKIQEFCGAIEYDRVSNVTFGELLKTNHNKYNKFNIDPIIYGTLHMYLDDLNAMKEHDKMKHIIEESGLATKNLGSAIKHETTPSSTPSLTSHSPQNNNTNIR